MSAPTRPADDQQVLTYVLPDEPDTLHLVPGTAQDEVPDGAIQGLTFCAADLCREVESTRDVIRALVICGVRFERHQTEVHGPNDLRQENGPAARE